MHAWREKQIEADKMLRRKKQKENKEKIGFKKGEKGEFGGG